MLLGAIFALGTAGYCLIEGASAWDAFYMTAITLTTVGYGEVFPLSRGGEVFTVVPLLAGLGAILTVMDRNLLSVEDGVKARVEAPRGLRRQPVGVRGAMLGCTRAMGTGVYHLQSVEKLSLAGLGAELLDALLRMGC